MEVANIENQGLIPYALTKAGNKAKFIQRLKAS